MDPSHGIAAALGYALIPAGLCLWLRRDRGVDRDLARVWIGRLGPLVIVWFGALLLTLLVSALTNIVMKKDAWLLACAGASALCIPVALMPARVRAVVGALWLLALGLLGYADTLTLRGLDSLPSLVTFSSGGNVWSVRDSVVGLTRSRDACLLAFIPAAAAVLAWPAARARARASGSRPVRRELLTTLALVAALSMSAWPLWDATDRYMDGRFSWKVFRVTDWVHRGVVTAHVFDSARVLRERFMSREITPRQRAELRAYFASRVPAAPDGAREQLADFGLARGYNVILLQVEALQQWVIDVRHRGERVMPFLDSLRERSQYFTRIYDQTGSAPTSNCEYATLCSQHPLAVGAVSFRRTDNRFVSLPWLLKSHGYTTASAHAYKRGYWNRSRFHPQLGFDHSYFKGQLGRSKRMGWGMSDAVFLERGLDKLAALPQPLLGLLITLTSHHPYKYVPRKQRSLRRVYGLRTLGNYLHSMRYVDESLEIFFKHLRASPLADRTLVVLYGDHDAKLRFKGKVKSRAARQLSLSEPELEALSRRSWSIDRIPLLIVWPDAERVGEIDTVGGQIDIAPTILHYLGIERPRAFLGRALLQGRPGSVVRMDGSAADALRVLSDGEAVACRDHDRRELDPLACQGLAAAASLELSMSWAVTLGDLQRDL